MDIRKIKQLIELLDQTGISEIEIKESKEGETSLRLSRYPVSMPVAALAAQQQSTCIVPATHVLAVETATAPIPVEITGHTLRSPMVGTLYVSASPESAPFVSVGKTVKKGETLCIIEAMKMFNEIESDRDGVISAMLVANGEPVEYDQPLFIIE